MFRTAAWTALTTSALALAALAPAVAHADGGYGYGPPRYAPPPQAVVYVDRPSWWYLGAGLIGTDILDAGLEPIQSGGGVSLWAGVNLSRALSLELGWFGTLQTNRPDATGFATFASLEGVTADAKIHLTRGPIDPYLQVGVGAYRLDSLGIDVGGPGFQVGGGVDFWVGRHVTLGARALYRAMAFNDGNDANDGQSDVVHAATLEGSISFHF